MEKIIIGIGGRKRAGKNTLAQAMIDYANSIGYSATEGSFAWPMKDMLQRLFGSEVEPGTFMDDDKKQNLVRVAPNVHRSVRNLLQTVGTDCFRDKIHPDFWVDRALNSLSNAPDGIYIFTDLRFPNELEAIRSRGGHTIYIERRYPEGKEPPIDNHPSETALLKHIDKFTHTVVSDSGDISKVQEEGIYLMSSILQNHFGSTC